MKKTGESTLIENKKYPLYTDGTTKRKYIKTSIGYIYASAYKNNMRTVGGGRGAEIDEVPEFKNYNDATDSLFSDLDNIRLNCTTFYNNEIIIDQKKPTKIDKVNLTHVPEDKYLKLIIYMLNQIVK